MKLFSLVLFASLSISTFALPTKISPDLQERGHLEQRGGIPGWNWLRDLFRKSKGGLTTENGVKKSNGCQPLTLIFARGTDEKGNMGDIIGPPLATALRALLKGKVAVQGVDYPASLLGNLNFGEDGGAIMVDLVNHSLSQCPESKVVLAGYSQGAAVIHNASRDLQDGQVARAVLFGDPLHNLPLRSIAEDKVMWICAEGDPICRGGLDIPAHWSYAGNANEAASFLAGAVRGKY
ncbi:cutinase [[Emmonsia] crescens]|uniref:cutinase n=1 Tax=[Emmonsia] crescens TaxID=73230 RepID=A0A0G2J4Q7_9EURO|nr:cutinase [Emmonsia crescens UAMH 3008]